MKDGMDFPVRRRKFEADCHWTKDFGDSEWVDEFGSLFFTNAAEQNVLV